MEEAKLTVSPSSHCSRSPWWLVCTPALHTLQPRVCHCPALCPLWSIGPQPGNQGNPASSRNKPPTTFLGCTVHGNLSPAHGVLVTPRSITINTALHLLTSAVRRLPAQNLGKMVPGGKPFGFQNCCNVTEIAGRPSTLDSTL